MIEIKNLYKSFGSKEVLKGINLLINKGETLAIIGKSGTGKSVLLKHIVGLLEPDKGEVFVEGWKVDIGNHKKLYQMRSKFGYLFQGAALFDSMTVGENVGLPLTENNSKIDKDNLYNSIEEVLNLVGLSNIQHLKPSELSGGMKKRVGLARALIHEPEYILYDEPTTGLDPIMSDSIDDLIKNLNNTLNVTSIVITHDMFTVKNVADRIAMVYNGVIHFEGTVQDMVNAHDEVVENFIQRTSLI